MHSLKEASGGDIQPLKQLPPLAVDHLKSWYADHESNPFPTMTEKTLMAETVGLTTRQISGWFYCERERREKARKKNTISHL